MSIENLQDLIDLVGKPKVDRLFTEYMMLQTIKASNFDKVASQIDVSKYIGEHGELK